MDNCWENSVSMKAALLRSQPESQVMENEIH